MGICKNPCKWWGNHGICIICEETGKKAIPKSAQDAPKIAKQGREGITAREKAEKPKMTKCEAEYGMRLKAEFPDAKIIFEGISLKMSNGHRYTPDWMVIFPHAEDPEDVRFPLLVEVKARGKNGFRQSSYGRAKLAYDQCKQEFGCFQWRWSEKYKGEWSK